MRKLLVVLAVLLAVGLFAGALEDANQFKDGYSLNGTVYVQIGQWLTSATMTVTNATITVLDFGQNTWTLGTVSFSSNATVSVYIENWYFKQKNNEEFEEVPRETLMSWINGGIDGITIKLNDIQFNKSTGKWEGEAVSLNAPLQVTVNVGSDFPAGTYMFGIELKLMPTVTF